MFGNKDSKGNPLPGCHCRALRGQRKRWDSLELRCPKCRWLTSGLVNPNSFYKDRRQTEEECKAGQVNPTPRVDTWILGSSYKCLHIR